MLRLAVEVDLHYNGRLVSNIADIRKSWQTDASVENQKKIFHVLFGGFDDQSRWQKDMELTYMNERNYEYINIPSWTTKKCVERMMTSQKNCIVEKINKSTDNTHGLYLSIVRPGSERLENPNRRRTKSVFRKEFVVRITYCLSCIIHVIQFVLIDPFIMFFLCLYFTER